MTTWNSADKNANLTLSNGDLTASAAMGNYCGVRATTSKSSGKWYFEVTLNNVWNYDRIGLVTASQDLSGSLSTNGGSVAPAYGCTEGAGSYFGSFALAAADVVGVAIDFTAQEIKYYKNGVLLGTSTGFALSPVYAFVSSGGGSSMTANFMPTSPPSGYAAWDGGAAPVSKSWLMHLVDGVKKGLKGIAKGALPIFDGNKWGVLESSAVAGQVLTTAADGTISWTTPAAGGTPADDSITNAKLANVAVNTIKGRKTAGTGDPEDLSAADALDLLGAVSTSGGTINGELVVNGNIEGIRSERNAPHVQLGSPTVEEMAIIKASFGNKMRFNVPSQQEQSTNGTSWMASTRATANNLGDLMIGDGNITDIQIMPTMAVGAKGYYRLTWTATEYVFLDALYLYISTNGSDVDVKIEKWNAAEGWLTVDNGAVNGWPCHVYFPHAEIYFDPTVAEGKYQKVRVTFSVTNAAGGNEVYLDSVEWYGGYSAAPRDIYEITRFKDVGFPGGILLGPGIAGSNTAYAIVANNGDPYVPVLRYEDGSNTWQISNDGQTFYAIPISTGLTQAQILMRGSLRA